MQRFRRLVAAIALAATATTTVAACGGGDSGDSSDAKTLKLWHYESAERRHGHRLEQGDRDLQDRAPGRRRCEFERKAFEQIQQNAGMILNSDEGPDIMEYNKGNATAGLLASQGLLTDLTDRGRPSAAGTSSSAASLQTTAKYDEQGRHGLRQLVRRARTTAST